MGLEDTIANRKIAEAKAVYDRARVDSQSLVNCLEGNEPEIECEELFYAGAEAYEAITGEIPQIGLAYPRHPAGEPWTKKKSLSAFLKWHSGIEQNPSRWQCDQD